MSSHYPAQVSLELLGSRHPPSSASEQLGLQAHTMLASLSQSVMVTEFWEVPCSIQMTWCDYQCPIPISSAHLITRKQTPFLPRWTQTRDNKSMRLHESFLTHQTLWFLSPKLGVSKLFWRGETATRNIYRTVHPAPAHHKPVLPWEPTVNLGFWPTRQVTAAQTQIQSRKSLLSL